MKNTEPSNATNLNFYKNRARFVPNLGKVLFKVMTVSGNTVSNLEVLKMNKKTMLFLGLTFIGIVLSASVFAFPMIGITQEQREKIQQAIENGNYEEWQNAMKEKAKERYEYELSQITQENFNLVKEMYEARKTGDYQKMWELRQKAGFRKGLEGYGWRGNCPMYAQGLA